MTKKLPALILALLAMAGTGKMIESQQAAATAALQTIAQVQAHASAWPPAALDQIGLEALQTKASSLSQLPARRDAGIFFAL